MPKARDLLPVGMRSVRLGGPKEPQSLNSVDAAEFKAKCLCLMDEVARTDESLLTTQNGKPVAMLSPYGRKRASLAGLHRGSMRILGDIVSPLDEPLEADD